MVLVLDFERVFLWFLPQLKLDPLKKIKQNSFVQIESILLVYINLLDFKTIQKVRYLGSI